METGYGVFVQEVLPGSNADLNGEPVLPGIMLFLCCSCYVVILSKAKSDTLLLQAFK
jgi:hypothetical protein